ncbi:SDR family NAD(P)-dependent oxidoreductase [Vibrio ziniensis]|uniref:SDR family NAD(P)-dependent oxidoreductase n=1 Tax=Vibrio ziniensis TaxID=2711221 RepID=A0A6G7CJB7_9VIBR|nr:SDR family NAD(P)-dependent oxidoreductase [Vibrio ziniensis]QIH42138.1 SDR family NAD(P)-dependent oxidoreductase [Vibrio ziniensis]
MTSVLITGATSGIGRQLAIDYATRGWNVIACGRNKDVLTELSEKFANIDSCDFDVTDRMQTVNTLRTLPWIPSLWILNAGNCEYIDNGKMDAKLVERVFQTNVFGLTNIIEAIEPHLMSGQRVAIVSSIASELALPRAEAYGASKAAAGYIARSLRLDWRERGVEVSTIFPGFVDTPLTAKNTFSMPMLITVEQASKAIQNGLDKGLANIYFPKRFTWILRALGALPYSWQHAITGLLFKS